MIQRIFKLINRILIDRHKQWIWSIQYSNRSRNLLIDQNDTQIGQNNIKVDQNGILIDENNIQVDQKDMLCNWSKQVIQKINKTYNLIDKSFD